MVGWQRTGEAETSTMAEIKDDATRGKRGVVRRGCHDGERRRQAPLGQTSQPSTLDNPPNSDSASNMNITYESERLTGGTT